MAITKKDVAYAANLGRLKFSEQELEGFAGQLDRILGHVAKLNELDTSAVEATAHALKVHNVMRKDVADQKTPDKILFENAPALKDKYFEVPQILE